MEDAVEKDECILSENKKNKSEVESIAFFNDGFGNGKCNRIKNLSKAPPAHKITLRRSEGFLSSPAAQEC